MVNQKHLNDNANSKKERTSSMTGIMVPKVIVKPFDNEFEEEKEIPQRISMNEKIRLAKELKTQDINRQTKIEKISDVSDLDMKYQELLNH